VRFLTVTSKSKLTCFSRLGEVRNTMRKMEEVAQGTRRSFRVVGSRVAKAERPNQPRL